MIYRLFWMLLLLFPAPASAQLSPADVAQAAARPGVATRLPATLTFRDDNGKRTTLGAAAGGLPTMLMLVDYTCRHICGSGLTLTAGALKDAGMLPGRDLSLILVGIDAKDGPGQARAMADAQLGGLPAIRGAMHLLSGDATSIAAMEKALGYTAIYDPSADQFAHDASLYIFTPTGKLSALLPEIGTPAASLRAAVARAASQTPSDVVQASFADQVITLCYGLATAHGRYSGPIALMLKVGALMMVAGLGWALLRLGRRTPR